MVQLDDFWNFDLTITRVSLVLEGSMQQGQYPLKKTGRHLFCFIYVLDGGARYQFADRHLDVKQGNILFLTKGYIYSIAVDVSIYKYIYVDFNMIAETHINFPDAVFEFKNHDIIENMFRKMDSLWMHKNPAHILKCRSVLYEIFALLVQKQATLYVPSYKNDKIKAAVNFLEANFTDQALSVHDLARIVRMSEVHFRRLFKEIYMVTPVRYLCLLRINRAKDLLKDNNYSVSSVAELVGYANVYYFS